MNSDDFDPDNRPLRTRSAEHEPSDPMLASLAKAQQQDIQPWERGPDWTDREWYSFMAMRDSAYPPNGTPTGTNYVLRDMTALCARLGLNYGSTRNLSSKHSWTWRLAQYDRLIDATYRRQSLNNLARMSEDHERIFALAHETIVNELAKLLDMSKGLNPALSAKDLIQLTKLVIDKERLHHGQVTERTQNVPAAAPSLKLQDAARKGIISVEQMRVIAEIAQAIDTSGEEVLTESSEKPDD